MGTGPGGNQKIGQYEYGTEAGAISGTVNWTQQTYTVTSGTHTLKWSYLKDASVNTGSDIAVG